MSIVAIVALDRNNAIGREGVVPWRFPADLKFFRERTTGHVCVMGRKTWLSLPKPLPRRLNVVLSRTIDSVEQPPPVSAAPPPTGALLLRSAAEALALHAYLAEDLYVIGGEQIYREFAAHVDRWIVTRVPLAVAGADAFLPPDFLREFEVAGDFVDLGDDVRVTFYERSVAR